MHVNGFQLVEFFPSASLLASSLACKLPRFACAVPDSKKRYWKERQKWCHIVRSSLGGCCYALSTLFVEHLLILFLYWKVMMSYMQPCGTCFTCDSNTLCTYYFMNWYIHHFLCFLQPSGDGHCCGFAIPVYEHNSFTFSPFILYPSFYLKYLLLWSLFTGTCFSHL